MNPLLRTFFMLMVFAASYVLAEDDQHTFLKTVREDPLKEAALAVLGNSCGTMSQAESENMRKQGKILAEAGDRVLPAIAEIVPNRYCSGWFVGNAARYATKFSICPPFHAVIKAHRDDEKFYRMGGNLFGIFEYYAVFGDRNDLKWMEGSVERLDKDLRRFADKSFLDFRKRLDAEK